MFFYLIHLLPHGKELREGKRNVRTLFIGVMLYILFHAFIYSDYAEKVIGALIVLMRSYFYYFLLGDIFVMAILYKVHYGKSILTELDFGISNDQQQLPKNNIPVPLYYPPPPQFVQPSNQDLDIAEYKEYPVPEKKEKKKKKKEKISLTNEQDIYEKEQEEMERIIEKNKKKKKSNKKSKK